MGDRFYFVSSKLTPSQEILYTKEHDKFSGSSRRDSKRKKKKKTDIWSNFRKWVGPITFQHDLGYSYGGNYNYYLCNLRISVSIFFFSEGHISSVFTPSLFLNTFSFTPTIFVFSPTGKRPDLFVFFTFFFYLHSLSSTTLSNAFYQEKNY